MKFEYKVLMLLVLLIAIPTAAVIACTNIIVTKGATTDGSALITYSADSHCLYGELYFAPAANYNDGDMRKIYEWDTGKFLGEIPQVSQTYQRVGNMNQHQLTITETTFGGRHELSNSEGIMDYGSLIYVALERAKTAREAIAVIDELMQTYGYYSSGESFSIADKEEAWIMELIGKGADEKGAVWVAVKIPDGYISAHANQARITTFPLNDPENCLYSKDVISFAKKQGYFDGEEKEFSFADAYAPLDFGALRFCEARVWSVFNMAGCDVDQYLDYAMGYDTKNRMPLYMKAPEKLSPKQVADFMRDHYDGTPMDMHTDIGAGGEGSPYRWRPMTFEH
ncbi:MAG: C69 family dipeptidase, partial [Rikenellaceae bacterium]